MDCTADLNKCNNNDLSPLLNTAPRDLPEYVRRFTHDIYMCVYIQPDLVTEEETHHYLRRDDIGKDQHSSTTEASGEEKSQQKEFFVLKAKCEELKGTTIQEKEITIQEKENTIKKIIREK